MAQARIEQRNGRLATEVKVEQVSTREGPLAKGTVVVITNGFRNGESEATAIRWTVWGKQAENASPQSGIGGVASPARDETENREPQPPRHVGRFHPKSHKTDKRIHVELDGQDFQLAVDIAPLREGHMYGVRWPAGHVSSPLYLHSSCAAFWAAERLVNQIDRSCSPASTLWFAPTEPRCPEQTEPALRCGLQ